MITVNILKDQRGYCGIDCFGHAFFDVEGRDVVCAAVSILIINTINGFEQFTEDSFVLETPLDEPKQKRLPWASKKEANFIHFLFEDDISKESTLLMNVMVMGLKEIQNRYGETYLTLEIKEV